MARQDAIRVAFLVSHPIQYQAPLLREIAQQTRVDLTVFFLSDLSVRSYRDPGFGREICWDVPLLGGYRSLFLPAIGRRDQVSFFRPFTVGLGRALTDAACDVLWVSGYNHHAILRAIFTAHRRRIRVILWGESNLKSHPRSAGKLWLKNKLLPNLFKRIDAFLAIGTLNRDYYLHYGVPPERIFMTPYAVDNTFFRERCERYRDKREQLRQSLGLCPVAPVILYASKFERRKRASDLLEAFFRLSPNGREEPRAHLLLVGDGDQREELEKRARHMGWSNIRFLGFQNQTELTRYYDLCDIFVLPSEYEPWGLVVNEAMNAGKAIVVSDQVGSGQDLVKNGENGFSFPVGDVAELAERLRLLITQPDLMRRMGEESRRRVERWGFTEDISGLNAALTYVLR
jgi:glycosyltransferase involved in cell wall biosynthesis